VSSFYKLLTFLLRFIIRSLDFKREKRLKFFLKALQNKEKATIFAEQKRELLL